MILQKVSFDLTLFAKEFLKAAGKLPEEEMSELRIWCLQVFGLHYCREAVPEFDRG
ncbi:MAG: hypothetical protein R2767_04515 [Chitinophagales bacterium]|nr:hypothetical protein [Chitinophagales bacterium]HPE97323.1 hypothetical protein [Chitinophagales bacterium]HPR28692.1 hypothetical protein [Chitinophagales bacterium]HQU39669.1 hypothetical protein [Chitinophagales bacterium]HQU75110.1 hypothetical protein [Chitinophagales bacterium]